LKCGLKFAIEELKYIKITIRYRIKWKFNGDN